MCGSGTKGWRINERKDLATSNSPIGDLAHWEGDGEVMPCIVDVGLSSWLDTIQLSHIMEM